MLALMLMASAADLATTEYAIASGYAIEGNPLMRSQPVRIAAGFGLPILAYALTRDRPRLAKWICVVHVGVHSAAAGWNVYVGVRVRWGER
jgi:hypothetical protein